MFLQNLLRKISNIFSKKNLSDLLINSYREIIIFISVIGVFVIIIIVFILLIRPKKEVEYKDMYIETSKNDLQDLLITPSEFIMPTIKSFDLTNDYVEFLPARSFQLPDINTVVKDYNRILKDTIEDSCKFNFEKRKEIKRRKK